MTGDANATRICINDDCRGAWPSSGGSTQWGGAAGGPIYYTDGPVGIGTVSPGDELEVIGAANISKAVLLGTNPMPYGNVTGRLSLGSYIGSTYYEQASLQGLNDGGGWARYTDLKLAGSHGTNVYLTGKAKSDAKGDNDSYIIGNLGVGTSNPQAQLHVGGTPGVDGIMFPDGTLQTTASGGGGGAATIRENTASYGIGSGATCLADCAAGEALTGGGCRTATGDTDITLESYPEDADTYRCDGARAGSGGTPGQIHCYAICLAQ